MRSGHTPGNGFDWPAKPGEGSRRVPNPRWVRYAYLSMWRLVPLTGRTRSTRSNG